MGQKVVITWSVFSYAALLLDIYSRTAEVRVYLNGQVCASISAHISSNVFICVSAPSHVFIFVCLTVRLSYSYNKLGVEGLPLPLCVHQLHGAVLQPTLNVGKDRLVPRVQHQLEKIR